MTPVSPALRAARTARWSMLLNALLAIVKWLSGFFGNSYALIADAIESSADVFASLLIYFGIKYATRPPDENHPYGHGRAETLATFLVVVFLISSAVVIAFHSLQNIRTPHELPEPYTLFVLGGIIVWKELSYRWMLKRSRELNSPLLHADAWHHRSDAITSFSAFAGISFALFMGKGYESADDYAALLSSCFILFNAYRLFRPALGEVMDEQNHAAFVAQIRTISKQVEGVRGTEKCFIRKAGMAYLAEIHVIVDSEISVREGHDIAHRLEDKLKSELKTLTHVVIHVEPESAR